MRRYPVTFDAGPEAVFEAAAPEAVTLPRTPLFWQPATPWDPSLAAGFERHRKVVHEERG